MTHIDGGLRRAAFERPRVTLGGFLTMVEVADLAILAIVGMAAHWWRFDTWFFTGSRGLVAILAVLIAYFVFRRVALHDVASLSNPFAQMRQATKAMLVITFTLLAVGYATKTSESISRLWLVGWLFGSWAALVLSRPVISHVYQKLESTGIFERYFVIFATAGELASLQKVVDRWSSTMHSSDVIAGIFLDDPKKAAASPDFHAFDLVRGSIDDFLASTVNQRIDCAVAVMPADNGALVEPLLQKIRAVSLDVDLIVGRVDEIWSRRETTKVAGLPSIRVVRRSLNAWQLFVKRAEDLVVASLALLFFGPLMLLIALGIKLDSPGPVFFRQARHGFNNRPFYVFKFRTMRHNDEVLSDLSQARRNDPRVTRFGAFLRKTSLDELPQIFNVLRGEMSIVGPRPHAVEHNDMFAGQIDAYLARHRIRPGITGWAQVNGLRGETDTLEKMRRRVEHDLYYVDHWSLAFDFKIMILTVPCLVHRNAY